MEGGGPAAKKFSLKIKSSAASRSAFDKNLVQNADTKEETDFVTEVSGNRIKGSLKPNKKKEFVVPALDNESLVQRKLRLKYGADIDREIKQEIKDEPSESAGASGDLANGSDSGPVIPAREGNQLDLSLETAVEPPTMDAYEEMPIEEFGTALLRGMGWKPGRGIGARCTSGEVKPIEVKVRPKGLGLGAEQLLRTSQEQQDYENQKKADGKETLIVKSGAYVRIIGGTHQGKYGQVDAMDEDAGRVHLSLALTKDKVSCNEALVVAVNKQEYNDFGKCLNRDRYDDYKRKHEGSRDSRPSEKIDLAAGFKDEASSRNRKDKAAEEAAAKKRKIEDERPFIGYWLRSQIRVRIIDDGWKDGRYANEKVIVEDVLGKDICLCRTEGGRLLEDVKMKMLETVLPRTSVQDEVPVIVVAGKYAGEIGHIVERDKKASVAYVEFLHDKTVHKLGFDYVCEYVGQLP